jgi:hypothetical protein
MIVTHLPFIAFEWSCVVNVNAASRPPGRLCCLWQPWNPRPVQPPEEHGALHREYRDTSPRAGCCEVAEGYCGGNLGGGENSSSGSWQPVYSYYPTYDVDSNVTSYNDSVMGCWNYDTFGNHTSQSMSTTACASISSHSH